MFILNNWGVFFHGYNFHSHIPRMVWYETTSWKTNDLFYNKFISPTFMFTVQIKRQWEFNNKKFPTNGFCPTNKFVKDLYSLFVLKQNVFKFQERKTSGHSLCRFILVYFHASLFSFSSLSFPCCCRLQAADQKQRYTSFKHQWFCCGFSSQRLFLCGRTWKKKDGWDLPDVANVLENMYTIFAICWAL